jgi:hypothetical protein
VFGAIEASFFGCSAFHISSSDDCSSCGANKGATLGGKRISAGGALLPCVFPASACAVCKNGSGAVDGLSSRCLRSLLAGGEAPSLQASAFDRQCVANCFHWSRTSFDLARLPFWCRCQHSSWTIRKTCSTPHNHQRLLSNIAPSRVSSGLEHPRQS